MSRCQTSPQSTAAGDAMDVAACRPSAIEASTTAATMSRSFRPGRCRDRRPAPAASPQPALSGRRIKHAAMARASRQQSRACIRTGSPPAAVRQLVDEGLGRSSRAAYGRRCASFRSAHDARLRSTRDRLVRRSSYGMGKPSFQARAVDEELRPRRSACPGVQAARIAARQRPVDRRPAMKSSSRLQIILIGRGAICMASCHDLSQRRARPRRGGRRSRPPAGRSVVTSTALGPNTSTSWPCWRARPARRPRPSACRPLNCPVALIGSIAAWCRNGTL